MTSSHHTSLPLLGVMSEENGRRVNKVAVAHDEQSAVLSYVSLNRFLTSHLFHLWGLRLLSLPGERFPVGEAGEGKCQRCHFYLRLRGSFLKAFIFFLF